MNNVIDSIKLSGTVYTLSAQTEGGGVPESAFTAYTASTNERISQDEEVTAAGLNALNDKITPTVELTQAQYDALVTAGTVSADTYYIITDAQAGDLTNYYTKSETNTLLGGKADTATTYTKTEVDNAITAATSTKQDTLVSGTNIKTINNTSILGSGNIDIQGGGKAIEAGRGISITTGATADTISFSLPISADTNNNFIYGSTTNTVDNNSVVNYNTLIGTGNTITHTGSLVPKMYENIIYGERNTISFKGASATEITNNLILGFNNNIGGDYGYNKGYGRYNIVCGYSNGLNKSDCSFVHGWVNSSNGNYQFLNGYYLQANNNYEATFGKYNVSNSATTTFGNSGNTLFSVGNGTSASARHNAFEIRQNGDIYLSLNGQDVKLQDQLGGSSITVDTALDSGSTNPVENRVIYNKIDEVEQVTAAGLNAVNDALGGLKLVSLSLAEYNALATKDSSTLYIIVN